MIVLLSFPVSPAGFTAGTLELASLARLNVPEMEIFDGWTLRRTL
jgi:hypothetical protein